MKQIWYTFALFTMTVVLISRDPNKVMIALAVFPMAYAIHKFLQIFWKLVDKL